MPRMSPLHSVKGRLQKDLPYIFPSLHTQAHWTYHQGFYYSGYCFSIHSPSPNDIYIDEPEKPNVAIQRARIHTAIQRAFKGYMPIISCRTHSKYNSPRCPYITTLHVQSPFGILKYRFNTLYMKTLITRHGWPTGVILPRWNSAYTGEPVCIAIAIFTSAHGELVGGLTSLVDTD